ncbi:aminotransferase class I/II-fold pyridoxal phosphate-dependent enzyme [Nonomuraea muscovyensis]|uniref:8-amino-7-oxononanoate synthase n=1 Tax=Nonomuraea muscovyensis TaxID=1124761 RepID=A0A7X0F358_9ACTN|nr:aminotransferase class I/II-fold pyridoxal phosphate-dependent enzyme [Nonomuraea muscovyensis]MBB6351755.1 7-keto-8-aminopelargonate synthetase-like enzyme [Nonomuraea muscovyensis]
MDPLAGLREATADRQAAGLRRVLRPRTPDGDLAPVAEPAEAVGRHGALLVVAEAHSLGVVGEDGRGLVHSSGLFGASHIVRTVTLSTSLGSQGGAVLGEPEVIDTLIDTGRSFIFDTGLAPASVAAASAAADILQHQPELPGRARLRAGELAAMVRELGLETSEPAGAVVPVVLGPPETALAAAATCAELGVRVGCFRPPSAPEGRSCLRLTARANLSSDDLAVIRHALTAVAEVKVRA